MLSTGIDEKKSTLHSVLGITRSGINIEYSIFGLQKKMLLFRDSEFRFKGGN